jgi:type VI secretion system protein VasG
LIVELDTLETQYQQEQELTEQLLACRRDLASERSRFTVTTCLVQHASPLGLDVDARTVATVIADWTGFRSRHC